MRDKLYNDYRPIGDYGDFLIMDYQSQPIWSRIEELCQSISQILVTQPDVFIQKPKQFNLQEYVK